MSARWQPSTQSWTITLWSASAVLVRLLVVDRDDPFGVVRDEVMVRDGDVWSITVACADIGNADLYGFRVEGHGHRFDSAKVLLDPEATQVWFPPEHDRDLAAVHGADTLGRSPLAVLRREVPRPALASGPRHAWSELVVYESHVRGATQLAEHVPSELRGTFAGLRHHAAYLALLGVTAIELLPVHQCDPLEGSYWGYMPLAWSALHHEYVAGDDPEGEFVEMVQAFHDVGIEVLLDVVYNHTTEEDEFGPTYHLRGIDDAAYYVVDSSASYYDAAGCGNVVRAAHPAAAGLIMASLRRYADLGVDGFRFDLGSLLGRDFDGITQQRSSLIDEITTFAAMRGLRLITEPWDLGAYQLGDGFPGQTWSQWNGQFRDDVRSYIRGEEGFVGRIAQRLRGSPDLFGADSHRSINFVTAHDGFTLYDLVSYDRKHNDANGHDNTDGTDDNRSWNCGHEGDDVSALSSEHVHSLRALQMRNLLCLLMLSRGVPMLLAGDEFAHTQHGNNNAYNQDNPVSWLDWQRAATHGDIADFVRALIALRSYGGDSEVTCFGVDGDPDFSYESHSIAWQWGSLYVMSNAWWEPLTFAVQATGDYEVALASCVEPVSIADGRVTVPARCTVVLLAVEAQA